jgi:hypothetical protein
LCHKYVDANIILVAQQVQTKERNDMANELSSEKKVMAVAMLCEGSSIRAIERMTGVHRDTIMRLVFGWVMPAAS